MSATWVRLLLSWYANSKRAMPWRDEPSPYHILVSEFMLQQTQVATVIPYFNRFIKRYPTISDLAAANSDDLLKQWEGLGYYSRVRNLHKTAKIICTTHNHIIPKDYKTLQTLPGIGPYAAAAIGSIAYDLPVPVVDGNVLRVFTRFWGIYDDIRKTATRQLLYNKLTPYLSGISAGTFNQAIMECGALICTPKLPQCQTCPLQTDCVANLHQKQTALPVKTPLKKVPTHTIAIGVLIKDHHILIAKRDITQMLGGLWEFPGGKLEKNETASQALLREFKEELGVTIAIKDTLCTVKHAYTHFKIICTVFICSLHNGIPTAHASKEIRWVPPHTLSTYAFPKANLKIMPYLTEYLQSQRS